MNIKTSNFKISKINYKKSFVTNEKGIKTAVIIPIKEYEELIRNFEDKRDIEIANNIMKRNPKFVKYDPNEYK